MTWHEKTWHFGGAVPGQGSVECQIVSVDEEGGKNVLYLNARSTRTLEHRVQALSLNDGKSFQESQLVEWLPDPKSGCHEAVVGFPALLNSLSHRVQQWMSSSGLNHTLNHSAPTWLVYTLPTGTHGPRGVPQLISS